MNQKPSWAFFFWLKTEGFLLLPTIQVGTKALPDWYTEAGRQTAFTKFKKRGNMAGERRRRLRPQDTSNVQIQEPASSRYALPEQSRSSRTGTGFPNRGEAIAQVEERGHAVEKNRVIPFQTEDEEEGWNESGRSAEKRSPEKHLRAKKPGKSVRSCC